jgi:ABC-type uncharacterized transport system ATPase subunit
MAQNNLLCHASPKLLIDEPFSGFDPVNANNIIKDEILKWKMEPQ